MHMYMSDNRSCVQPGGAMMAQIRGWFGAGTGLSVSILAFTFLSGRFAARQAVPDLPVLTFVGGYLLVAIVGLGLLQLVRRSQAMTPAEIARLTWLMLLVGLGLRLVLLTSHPVLEVDFNRYLWDGGMVASGFNPYAVAPARIADLAYNDQRLDLSKVAGEVFDGISYPRLKTIYPPVAQMAFAFAHWLSPWSLTAWRLVAIAADVATVVLLMALLKSVRRSPLWSTLYWWNPLVLKEIANSAHMEAVLMPLVLAAVLLSIRQRHVSATLMLGLAVGVKLWPVVLAPLLLRPLSPQPGRLAAAALVFAATIALAALPIILGGLDATSGFVSYANHWSTNSAHFPPLEQALRAVLGALGPAWQDPTRLVPGQMLRLISAAVLAAFALCWSRRAIKNARDVAARAYGICTVLVLLSPAQFPWYVLWVLPFAVLQPRAIGWHVAAALMPLYYLAFATVPDGSSRDHLNSVWLIWLPTWLALSWDASRHYRASRQHRASRQRQRRLASSLSGVTQTS
jgi:alpha-1,6-mannosyltransferase